MKPNKNLTTLDQLVTQNFGEPGNLRRDQFESDYESFKLGFLLQQARLQRGMTQEELAEKCGTNKGYISKVENDVKEIRLSTLRKIVEKGFGGRLELSIKL